MLDSYARTLIAPVMDRLAESAVRRGFTANQMTLFGVLAGVFSFLMLPFGFYGTAVLGLVLNRVFDGLDGAVARLRENKGLDNGVTDIGGYFDIVSDLIFYSGFIFFYGLGQPQSGLIAAFLLFSYMGTSSTFLAFAVLAAKKGIADINEPSRSMFYLGGLTEGTETLIFMLLICVAPIAFPVLAIVFAVMCWLTTYGRVREAIRVFGPRVRT